jgi:hypothetical protein
LERSRLVDAAAEEYSSRVRHEPESRRNGTMRKLIPLVGTIAGAALLCTGPALGDLVSGTDGDDNLRGTDGPDTVHAHDGDDHIFGLAGPDYISAGPGNDTVRGGDGRDAVGGGPGDDRLYGGDDSDRMFGGPGADTFDDRRQDGGDEMNGGKNADSFTLRAGRQEAFGDDGRDSFILIDDERIDIVDCGPGKHDIVYYVAALDPHDHIRSNCESVMPYRPGRRPRASRMARAAHEVTVADAMAMSRTWSCPAASRIE